MPRYFFHLLHPGCPALLDDEGIAFDNDVIARREGMESLAELITDALNSNPVPLNVSVEIEKEGTGIIDLLTGLVAVRPQVSQA